MKKSEDGQIHVPISKDRIEFINDTIAYLEKTKNMLYKFEEESPTIRERYVTYKKYDLDSAGNITIQSVVNRKIMTERQANDCFKCLFQGNGDKVMKLRGDYLRSLYANRDNADTVVKNFELYENEIMRLNDFMHRFVEVFMYMIEFWDYMHMDASDFDKDEILRKRRDACYSKFEDMFKGRKTSPLKTKSVSYRKYGISGMRGVVFKQSQKKSCRKISKRR